MSRSKLRFILPVLLFLLSVPVLSAGRPSAPEDPIPEVGVSGPWPEDDPGLMGELDILESQLDLSVRYTRFTGEDMRDTYGGVPVVAAGVSFLATRNSRLFLSLGYGENSGDPFYATPGFTSGDHTKVRYVPFQLGIKVDLARSTRIHVYAGASLEFAWMEETFPLLGDNGNVADRSSSGINNGYNLTFGPELVLGRGGQALGLEVGWGGSKGTITTAGHHHDLDMTGYRGRLYFALAL